VSVPRNQELLSRTRCLKRTRDKWICCSEYTNMRIKRRQAGRQAMANANGGFVRPTRYPERSAKSVLERWKRYISPRVSKFIGVESTMARESGTNIDDHYRACCVQCRVRSSIHIWFLRRPASCQRLSSRAVMMSCNRTPILPRKMICLIKYVVKLY
jgi:hypothetical protein